VLAYVTRGDANARGGANDGIGVWTLRIGDGGAASAFVQTGVDADSPAFSPDGKWLAYNTFTPGSPGPPDVYVRPYPEGAPVQRISTEGGWSPRWSRDGRRLFYKTSVPDAAIEMRRWMVVDVTTTPTFTRSRPRPVITGTYLDTGGVANYDIDANDARFLVVQRLDVAPQPVTRVELVVNWFDELAERVPVR
jgi:hypothetical protein